MSVQEVRYRLDKADRETNYVEKRETAGHIQYGPLFGSLAEYVDGDTIDEAIDRCTSQVQ